MLKRTENLVFSDWSDEKIYIVNAENGLPLGYIKRWFARTENFLVFIPFDGPVFRSVLLKEIAQFIEEQS